MIGGRGFDIVDGGPNFDACVGEFVIRCELGSVPTPTQAATPSPTATVIPSATATATPAGTTAACLQGIVVVANSARIGAGLAGVNNPASDSPISGAHVWLVDGEGDESDAVESGENGAFCLASVPAFVDAVVSVETGGEAGCGGLSEIVTTGPPGGSCDAGDCRDVGAIECFGSEASF